MNKLCSRAREKGSLPAALKTIVYEAGEVKFLHPETNHARLESRLFPCLAESANAIILRLLVL